MNIQEVSELTRIPVATLRYYRHKQVGPRGAKLCGRLMYRRADVESWINDAFETKKSA